MKRIKSQMLVILIVFAILQPISSHSFDFEFTKGKLVTFSTNDGKLKAEFQSQYNSIEIQTKKNIGVITAAGTVVQFALNEKQMNQLKEKLPMSEDEQNKLIQLKMIDEESRTNDQQEEYRKLNNLYYDRIFDKSKLASRYTRYEPRAHKNSLFTIESNSGDSTDRKIAKTGINFVVEGEPVKKSYINYSQNVEKVTFSLGSKKPQVVLGMGFNQPITDASKTMIILLEYYLAMIKFEKIEKTQDEETKFMLNNIRDALLVELECLPQDERNYKICTNDFKDIQPIAKKLKDENEKEFKDFICGNKDLNIRKRKRKAFNKK
jgi:hypothetical protein